MGNGQRPRRSVALVVATGALIGSIGLASCSSSGGTAAPKAATPATDASTDSTSPGARPSPGCDSPSTEATTGAQTISVGGLDRHYEITLPTDRKAGDPAPVVLVFHGYSGASDSFGKLTGLPERGAAAGAVVVVPDGRGSPQTWAFTSTGPDVDFVDALLDHLAATECIDLARVYATGFSAGAAFTIAYTCARQDRIAAMATVAVDFQLGCTSGESILAFHGTMDPAVPYVDGGKGASLPGVAVRGTELNMGDWARLDGCADQPTTTSIGSEVTRSTWDDCPGDREVILYTVIGGGHTWPGADPKLGQGLTTQQISATDLALAFFARHHL